MVSHFGNEPEIFDIPQVLIEGCTNSSNALRLPEDLRSGVMAWSGNPATTEVNAALMTQTISQDRTPASGIHRSRASEASGSLTR